MADCVLLLRRSGDADGEERGENEMFGGMREARGAFSLSRARKCDLCFGEDLEGAEGEWRVV